MLNSVGVALSRVLDTICLVLARFMDFQISTEYKPSLLPVSDMADVIRHIDILLSPAHFR
jgi:hypothetical protein